MPSDLVLITGATGHIGFRALLIALSSGYAVRAAVRSQAKADSILSHPSIKAINSGDRLTFVTVPDLTAPNAYDAAVQGAKYVIHIASPITTGGKLTTEEYEQYFIKPAVDGTVGMLKSAAKSGTVKRLVITSSVVAIIPFKHFAAEETDRVFGPDDRVADHTGAFQYGEFEAYSASKVAALNATERFMEVEKPGFDVVNIHPSFVIGKDELVTSPEDALRGTNGVPLSITLGVKEANLSPGASVHNEDVARGHVEALRENVPAGSYVFHWMGKKDFEGTRWEEVNEIVERNFPEAVKQGVLKNDGARKTFVTRIDSSKTEKVFGWELMGLEEQVKNVVGHYLELVEKK